MLRFRTLAQRFGTIYVLIVGLLLGVSVVVTLHLRGMNVDLERVIEEGREQRYGTLVLSELDALAHVAQLEQLTGADRARGSELITRLRGNLAQLEGATDDPSRDTHSADEARLHERIERMLLRIERMLAGGALDEGTDLASSLAQAQRDAAELLDEAVEETEQADRDLERRSRATTLVLVGMWVSALLLLGAALTLIRRGVVLPLGTMRDGAERFGSGDREHRLAIDNRDELGDLAGAFNEMAERLARSQDDLEQRVRQRTTEFLRAARLADLGLLASGVAHELNTPLASIASSVEGLQRRLDNGGASPEVVRDYAATIHAEVFRARDISSRMLALARGEPGDLATVHLELLVDQVLSAVRHRADTRGVSLAAAPVVADATVRVSAGELVQVLVNLLANAIDASSRGDTVRLDLELQGGHLEAVVSDEGEGIPEDDQERIFEPFYTTKRPGSGTGLGLALVVNLIESHGGQVTLTSEPGRGSTFRVRVPSDWSEQP